MILTFPLFLINLYKQQNLRPLVSCNYVELDFNCAEYIENLKEKLNPTCKGKFGSRFYCKYNSH